MLEGNTSSRREQRSVHIILESEGEDSVDERVYYSRRGGYRQAGGKVR